jgi:hypothetical protein
MLGYTRRCYIPPKQIEEMRALVSRQMQIGEKIAGGKSQIHSLLERNTDVRSSDGFRLVAASSRLL